MPDYPITPAAGDWIAGRRIQPGQTTITLTEAEAAYELDMGAIAPPAPPAPPAGAGKAKTASPPAET